MEPPKTTSPRKNPFEHAAEHSHPKRASSNGFLADLALMLLVPWMIIWRVQLFIMDGGVWFGWWPLAGLVLIPLIGLAGSRLQTDPRDILPYAARWALLSGVLVLTAWNIASVVQGPARSQGTVAIKQSDGSDKAPIFTESEVAALDSDLQKIAETATERGKPEIAEAARRSQDSASDMKKLAAVFEEQAESGELLPKFEDLPSDLQNLEPGMAEAQYFMEKFGPSIANGEIPPEAEAVFEAAGIDSQEAMTKALTTAAGYAIASYLGVSAAVIIPILDVLLSGGDVSLSTVVSAAVGLGHVAAAQGFIDAASYAQVLGEIQGGAQMAYEVVTMAEQLGMSDQFPPEVVQGIKEVAGAAAGIEVPGDAPASVDDCSAATLEEVERLRPGTLEEYKKAKGCN